MIYKDDSVGNDMPIVQSILSAVQPLWGFVGRAVAARPWIEVDLNKGMFWRSSPYVLRIHNPSGRVIRVRFDADRLGVQVAFSDKIEDVALLLVDEDDVVEKEWRALDAGQSRECALIISQGFIDDPANLRVGITMEWERIGGWPSYRGTAKTMVSSLDLRAMSASR
jgi:hypothetical protein